MPHWQPVPAWHSVAEAEQPLSPFERSLAPRSPHSPTGPLHTLFHLPRPLGVPAGASQCDPTCSHDKKETEAPSKGRPSPCCEPVAKRRPELGSLTPGPVAPSPRRSPSSSENRWEPTKSYTVGSPSRPQVPVITHGHPAKGSSANNLCRWKIRLSFWLDRSGVVDKNP